jgi:6-phosphofructokinase 1
VKRIAINIGSGYVPGLDAVVAGAAIAAQNAGLEIVGIRDGYDGLLVPDRYPDGGLLELVPRSLDAAGSRGSVLGTAARQDPFRVRTVTADGAVEEVDRSDDLLGRLAQCGIEAMISVVGGSAITGLHALSVAFKLQRKGLATVCVPKSVENEIAGVPLAFGYNSVLAHVTETLDRIRVGARDAGRLAVVEVPGQHAGWLALQSGMATLADAVLIPEIAYDVASIAAALDARERAGRPPALVVVAEGARSRDGMHGVAAAADPMRSSLAPNADPALGEGERVIDRTGAVAHAVATAIQRATDREVMPMSVGLLARGGAPTALDRQLGLAYGAAAVRALNGGESGVLVAFQPPDVRSVPLAEALNRVRGVPAGSELMNVARALGIAFGD